MNQITIPQSRLTLMWITILVLLLLLLLLCIPTSPTVNGNVLDFQRLLNDGKSNGALVIRGDGTFKVFDYKLAPVQPCGEIVGEDKRIPEKCKEGIKEEVPAINTATLLIFRSLKSNNNTVLAILGDPRVHRLPCTTPDGTAC